MKPKDLNIFVCETIIFHVNDKPEVKLFAEKCKVLYNWFDNLDINYQEISGFRLLINGPPRKSELNFSILSIFLSFKKSFSILIRSLSLPINNIYIQGNK